MKLQCQNNSHYADLLISNLTGLGVFTFCIGSGSRSSPLALALKKNSLAETILYYDERSLGFYALGAAKYKGSPVCLITTSGSAVSNLLPAVMEAFMGNTPLIIITCDRPFEDSDRGMNQTCNQENIFGNYVAASKTLPPPPHSFNINAISSAISYIFAKAKYSQSPVHLNVPFREPLIDDTASEKIPFKMTTKYLPTHTMASEQSVEAMVDILSSNEKGLIIAGGGLDKKGLEDIILLGEKTSYPILADPLSGLRENGNSSVIITHYNQIIHHTKKMDSLNPDVIIFVGGHIISKSILVWAKSLKRTHQIIVIDKDRHIDPTLQIDTCIKASPGLFAKAICARIKRKEPSLYLSLWQSFSLTASKGIDDFFDRQDKIFEPGAIINLLPLLEDSPFSLFIGNSLPIRYADNFLFPKKISRRIYGNRGVSGIDGNISTALGICESAKTPLVAVVGDATFLHDIGALHMMRSRNIPLIIIVINNNGGGIFHFLPYSNNKDFLDTHISPPTQLDTGNIATAFNIPFWRAEKSSDYTKMVQHLLSENTGGIIEIPSCKEENLQIHQELEKYLGKQMDKSIKKERNSYFSFPKRKKIESTSFASMDS
ncbi:MAG: 2-succinyl-5-enolpyruvyl-6-hydroxy-3-cyclohexene-1-carboxylate synthase [Chlamydiia bacterium]|nr:2-succinyl-5-enolpyruvyl-6-hydroxy-3-cyclohexene-1-carboxylate synthase [Chlamydiia bacterium]MCH9618133.1 2-succinyl-5-enolpyruvyl-6-hydroxy-3-cyclohexene-1-carboxylate synthase [Chlamydiia bacterium]MCH9624013.1 2-succinyl-5-enolpyruvyl-6-hydroxy-3-cyclohexene-1-carboxylate synthase [Chlamydiia bacterium]